MGKISRINAVSEMRQEGKEIYDNRGVAPIPWEHCVSGDQCYMVNGYRSEAWYYVTHHGCNCTDIEDAWCEHWFAVQCFDEAEQERLEYEVDMMDDC